ncbi:MAG TPA: hypothetical protein ENN34_05020 [Deltaproteobacteria bacterium]|nr:hypothetical protein [Deltaproteobacteria bacterium]
MKRFVCIGLCMLAAGLLAAASIHASAPWASRWHVVELMLDSRPYPGAIPYRNSWLNTSHHIQGGYAVLYSIELIPGRSYTLGLSCPTYARDVAVVLFDRWPGSPGARMVTLPMGPLVRTNTTSLEYRWNLGISPKSTSTLLYVSVEGRPTQREHMELPHTVFVRSTPTKPSSRVGQGITYLQGPQNLVLTGEREQVAYLVRKHEVERTSEFEPTSMVLAIPGDLVHNGWFTDGLNYWKPHRTYEVNHDVKTFSLVKDGLRIFSTVSHVREGLIQQLDADVSDADTLILRADVRVDAQAMGGTGPGGHDAPIAIAVGYETDNGDETVKENIFWQGFYYLEPQEPNIGKNGQKVPQGLWYRYIMNLMQIEPRPQRIKFIALEGSGWPQRDGVVTDVHLIVKKTPHDESGE